MKRSPLKRKTPLRARTRLRQRSTKIRAATSTERSRWTRMRDVGCICCLMNIRRMRLLPTGMVVEMHHLKSGDRRRGHAFTVALCHFHHQAKFLPRDYQGYRFQAVDFGPSLEREPAKFHFVYGSDDDLLTFQNKLLEEGAMSEGLVLA